MFASRGQTGIPEGHQRHPNQQLVDWVDLFHISTPQLKTSLPGLTKEGQTAGPFVLSRPAVLNLWDHQKTLFPMVLGTETLLSSKMSVMKW